MSSGNITQQSGDEKFQDSKAYQEEKTLLEKELQERKMQINPRDLTEIRSKMGELKDSFSRNYDKLIDMEAQLTMLKRIGLYDGQVLDQYDDIRRLHDQYMFDIQLIKKELVKHTEGPFHIREEALDTLYQLDGILSGLHCRARVFV